MLYFYRRRQQQLLPGSPERKTESLARWPYAAALAGAGPEHPVVRVLRATLELFASTGFHVLVYIVPINVEHLEALGLLDRAGLGRTLESVRQVVLASGASLLDLHHLLPDAGLLRRRRTPPRGRAPRRPADRRGAHRAGLAGGARRTLMRFDAVRRCETLRVALDWT